MTPVTAQSAPAPSAEDAGSAERCSNCATRLQGPHCHACGQRARGPVRHFRSVLGDLIDTALNIDGRLPRTLMPLLFQPGRLSLEFLGGRRIRYVSPVRLFVVISLLAFLAGRMNVETAVAPVGEPHVAQAPVAATQPIPSPPADVADPAGQAVTAAAHPSPAPERGAAETRSGPVQLRLGGETWHPQDNPLQLPWLPARANAQLNDWAQRGVDNLTRLRGDRDARRQLGAAVLDLLPQTLFLLLPVFALLLKLAYAFKRRLYMEHLIVALHSHAFLSLAVLLLALASLARSALGAGLLQDALGALSIALAAWMPLYLLIMQKRVYREGWPLTLLKFSLLGSAYGLLVGLGSVVTLLVGLVAM